MCGGGRRKVLCGGAATSRTRKEAGVDLREEEGEEKEEEGCRIRAVGSKYGGDCDGALWMLSSIARAL